MRGGRPARSGCRAAGRTAPPRPRSKLKPCQYNGLFDLYFNGGATWFASKTDLYRALKAGDMSSAASILQHDVPDGLGKKLTREITRRREQDATEFRTPRCPCQLAPVTGTFSGSVNDQSLGTLTWSGQVRYALVPGSEVLLFRHYYILGLDSEAAEATYVCNGSTISVGVNGTIGSPWLLSGETPYKKLELSGSYKSGLYSDKWTLNFELKPSIKP